jgi:N-acetylmuramoyl-L-alanine amidase
MFRPIRAAAFAAASLVGLCGAFYAGPGRALEMTTAPISASYLDHLSAVADGGDLSLNGLEQKSAPATGAPMPILDHAAAAAPVLAEEEAAPSRSLAGLVAERASAVTRDAQHECLAGAVYFEAKGEPLAGQLSVAEVVLNRARSGRFPDSVCAVVKQRGQFSFVRGGRMPAIARSSEAWRRAVAVASIALDELVDGHARGALFFHARRVSPRWRGLTRVASVGNHIFYR